MVVFQSAREADQGYGGMAGRPEAALKNSLEWENDRIFLQSRLFFDLHICII